MPAGTPLSAFRVLDSAWKGPLLTGLVYLLGAWVGLHVLRFPPATTSVLWPPNAILTAALLLAAPGRWWMYLLVTFPFHVVAEISVFRPVAMVPMLFASNCCEALIAALIVRSFNDRPNRFDTLQRMTVFIGGAVLAAPFLSSFLDAAIVSIMAGEAYWQIWTTRMSSNVLSQLTLVPPAVILLSSDWRKIRRAPRRVVWQAALLAMGTAAVCTAVFGDHIFRVWPISGLPAISLVLPLPFVLLAALRLGPAGASISLLIIAGILIWSGMHGHGPFSALPPAEGLLAIQTFLIVEALPLMCLSAIVEERRKAEAALQERLRFERLLSYLSREIVKRPTQDVMAHLPGWLASCGSFFDAEDLLLLRASAETGDLVVMQSWTRNASISSDCAEKWRTPAVVAALRHGSMTVVLDSVTAVSLRAGHQFVGGLVLRRDQPEPLSAENATRLQLVAEAFANILMRKRVEDERIHAEHAAQQSRAELVHLSRQRTMGALTASLAHELNQPLTGILGNAQAARRMLSADRIDVEELKLILDDVIADERRAEETIRGVRKWLRKSDAENIAIEMNSVILDVARLLQSDAVIRNLRLDLHLSPTPLALRGDPVELRQLIMNLLLNAMDATSSVTPDERLIVVRSDLMSDRVVHVSVQDSGDGVPPDAVDRLFEPFYTTKANGMGMGLSIAKAIVEAHKGSIWLSRKTRRGARFEFVLPRDFAHP